MNVKKNKGAAVFIRTVAVFSDVRPLSLSVRTQDATLLIEFLELYGGGELGLGETHQLVAVVDPGVLYVRRRRCRVASAQSQQDVVVAAPVQRRPAWQKCSIKCSVADTGSGAFLTTASGMDKKSGSGSGMNNPDHISESLETIFGVKILKFFDADPGSGMKKFGSRIRDRKNVDPGSAILVKWQR